MGRLASTNIIGRLFVLILAFGLVSCDTGDSGTVGNTNVVIAPTPTGENSSCTNLNGATGDPTALPTNGLVGNLYYLTDAMPRYSNVVDFMNNGVKAPVTLYLNRLYIPTRPFDEGFTTNSGTLIQTTDGTTLYEYFALHLESSLQLRADDPDGYYQIAMLSDDGSILQLNQNGADFTTFINDDGAHPTKMACASSAIYFDHTTKIPMKLDYFQGPRYHIALNMIWRQVSSPSADLSDPFCNQNGNSLFWDSTQIPSAPTGFLFLQAEGWRILSTENFALPTNVPPNPCGQNTPVTITNMNVSNVTQTSATVTWDTDVPANSIVTYSAYPYTTSASVTDVTMVTSHSVTLTGLTNFTLYDITVTSQAPDATNQVTSPDTTFKTLR